MNESLELEIHDVAFGGKGVARADGMVVFVPFVLPGERVKARLTRRKKRFAEGELDEVLVASPDRVEPPCPYFSVCGGCAYQHVEYARQLAIKQSQVEQTLRRIGKLEEVPMQPIIPSPKPYGYRNRIRVHVTEEVTGFYTVNPGEVVDVERCLLASDEVNERLQRLRSRGLAPGDYSVAEKQAAQFFEQTNPAVAKLLVEAVGRQLSSRATSLVDAYCGAGAFAHALAPRFERVTGIEENAFAIEHARSRAGENETYIQGAVEAVFGEACATLDAGATSVILDPPAAGLEGRALDAVLAFAPMEIVYVSCDPATMARDLAALTKVYRLLSVTPVDMFPQTAGIEVVAHLRAKSFPE